MNSKHWSNVSYLKEIINSTSTYIVPYLRTVDEALCDKKRFIQEVEIK
jgi:hypothetical protein